MKSHSCLIPVFSVISCEITQKSGASNLKLTFFLFQTGNGSGGSSRCSTPTTQQVTKVTATAKFKVEVHAPTQASLSEPPTRPASASSRRSSRKSPSHHTTSSTSGGSSVHSSLSDSLRSSLSSYDGDTCFSEK